MRQTGSLDLQILTNKEKVKEMKYAKNASNLKPSELRELTKLGAMPEVINFASGLPARELFPLEEMQCW